MTDDVVPTLRRGVSSSRLRRGQKMVWAAAVLACTAPALGSDETATWLGGTGNWSNATLWSSSPLVNQFPNNGNGGLTYDAVINGGSVTLDQDIGINGLTFTGGTITGPSSLTLNANSTWTGGGVMSGSGTTTVTNGIAIGPGGNSSEGLSRTLNLSAGSSSTLDPSQQGPNPGFYIGSGGVLNNSGTLTITHNGTLAFNDPTAVFNNSGTLNINGPTGTVAFSPYGNSMAFNNSGTVNVNTGMLQLGVGGNHTGSFTVASGAILEFSGATQNLQSQSSLTGAGTAVFAATTNINGTYNVATTGISQVANFNSSASTTTLQLSGNGNLGGSGSFTVTGTGSTWSGGTMAGAGTTTVANGIAISNALSNAALSRTLNLSAGSTSTLDLTASGDGGGPVDIANNGTLNNSGTLTITHAGTLLFNDPSATFNNAGTLTVNGPTGTVLLNGTGTFNNSGAVNVSTGMLQLGVGGNHTGSFAVASGAILEFYEGGTQNLQSQSSLTGAGTTVFAGTTNINGTYNVATTAISGQAANFNSSASTTTLQLSGNGNLGGSGSFTVTGTGSSWTNGTMSGPGTTTIINGIAIGPAGNYEDFSRTLNLSAGSSSTLDPSLAGPNPTFYIGTGGALNNSGTLTITHNGTVVFNDAAAVFNNSGTLNINGPTGTVAFSNNAGAGTAFNNSGTVNVDTGTLQLGVSGSQTGSFAVVAGATLDFHSGTQALQSSSSITGAGTVLIGGATVNVGGTYNVGTTNVGSGTINFNAPATTNALTISGGTVHGQSNLTVTNLTNNAGNLSLVSANTNTLTLNGGTTTIGPAAGGGGAAPATSIINSLVTTTFLEVSGGNNSVSSGGNLQVGSGGLSFTGSTGGVITLNSDASRPGLLTLGGDLTFTGTAGTAAISNSGSASIAGTVDLGGGSVPRSFTISDGPAAVDMLISARLIDGGLRKADSGWMQLTSANAYGGGTVLAGGVLEIDDPGALGSGAVTFSGGTLALRGKAANAAIPNALDGSSGSIIVDLSGTTGTVQVPSAALGPALTVNGSSSAKLLIAGPLTLTQSGPSVPTINNSANLEIAGTISGSGTMTKTLGGTLTFSGNANNTYTGTTTVTGGTLVLAKTSGVAIPGDLAIAGPATVQLDGPQQINSSSMVHFDSQPGIATLNLNGQSQTVAAVTETGLVNRSVVNGGGSLRANGNLSGDAFAIGGSSGPMSTVTVNSFSLSSLTINTAGTLALAHNATPAVSNTNSLTIAPGGKLDLANNTLMIHYAGGADPMPTILTYLASGYDNGKWDGSGIISSTAAANALQTTGIAYADSADPGAAKVAGLPANTIELKYELLGDTTLAGTVGVGDFTTLTQHYHQSAGGTWDTGDFNYDGSVNFNDFTLLTRTYNMSLGSTAQPGSVALSSALQAADAPVPEPAVLLLGPARLLWRRRRKPNGR